MENIMRAEVGVGLQCKVRIALHFQSTLLSRASLLLRRNLCRILLFLLDSLELTLFDYLVMDTFENVPKTRPKGKSCLRYDYS